MRMRCQRRASLYAQIGVVGAIPSFSIDIDRGLSVEKTGVLLWWNYGVHVNFGAEYQQRRKQTVFREKTADIAHEVVRKPVYALLFKPYPRHVSVLRCEPEHHRVAWSIWYGV